MLKHNLFQAILQRRPARGKPRVDDECPAAKTGRVFDLPDELREALFLWETCANGYLADIYERRDMGTGIRF